jgi:undecaprenyl diphosphate synthase
MDGNGRWAKERHLPRQAGHAAGSEVFRRVATHCRNLGIEALTVYALSTENRKRPPDEVAAIMDLLRKYLRESLESMERDGVRLFFLGDRSGLPEDVLALMRQTDELSARLPGMRVNVCLQYGGRDEIVRAARAALKAGVHADALDEAAFAGYLDTNGLPDPDLIIRPGREYRLSNFLLWQSAYAELYFCDVLWPDFSHAELDKALTWYAARKRTYGV